jgi:transcriptional regulator GlxA family with amidase domain
MKRHARPGWEREPLTGVRRSGPDLVIVVLVYRGVTTSEIELPARRLTDRLRGDVVFVGPRVGSVPGVEPTRDVVVDMTPADAPVADIVIVPGGLGWRQVAGDASVAAWLASAVDSSRVTLAVSTGSLLLAAAGRLAGLEATGHWLADVELAGLGAKVSSARTVSADHGRILTASGAHAAVLLADQIAEQIVWGPGPPSVRRDQPGSQAGRVRS